MSSDIPSEELDAYVKAKQSQDKQGKKLEYQGDTVTQLDRTLTQTLDYPHLIMSQIQNCQFCAMHSHNAFARSVSVLVRMIPTQERDDQFTEDIDKASHKYYVKTGHWHGDCGLRREEKKLVEDFEWDSVFEACINLFRRRGLLWSETQQEVF